MGQAGYMIRGGLALLIILWFYCGLAIGQDDPDELIEIAEAAYAVEAYDQTVESYRQLIAMGYLNTSIYFNLGSAYYETGQLGNALAYYLKAQAINPRDSAIQRQVWAIRAERVDFQRDPVNWIDRIGDSTRGLFTLTELAGVSFLLWCMAFISGGIWLVFRQRNTRIVVVLVLAITLVLNGLLFTRLYGEGQRPRAVITAPNVTVMSGPGDNYLPQYTLYDAAELRIVETNGIWARFVLPNGRQGWITRNVFVIV